MQQPGALTDDNVVFYCEMGQRSAVACEFAASVGLEHVYNLEGGMTAWRQLGYPVEKSRPASHASLTASSDGPHSWWSETLAAVGCPLHAA